MKNKLSALMEVCRIRGGRYGSDTGDLCGAFSVVGPNGVPLNIIASEGVDPITKGWEHVSVSVENRCPTWSEMCWVKNQFWEKDEWVVQFHPSEVDYVNYHPYTLHLWRRRHGFPTPPSILVGPKR